LDVRPSSVEAEKHEKMIGPWRKGCFSPLLCNKGPSYCPRKGLKIFVIKINLIKSFGRSWDQI
jgi:hypothetical protein